MDTNASAQTFAWPVGFKPDEARIFVRNALEVEAAPAVVWAWLVRARLWPTWYPHAKDVVVLDPPGGDLEAESRFTWATGGIALRTQVREYEPERRIAWFASSPLILAYHGWNITPTVRGCLVVTEESQRGPVTFGSLFVKPQMLRMHQTWLEELARKAREGLPPVVTRAHQLTGTFDQPIDRIESHRVTLAPLQKTGLHIHPGGVVGYLERGTVTFQIDGGPAKILQAGDAFYEPPNTLIRAFDNISAKLPAVFIANYPLLGDQALIEARSETV